MSRSLRRGALAATVLTLSIASLSACGAGNDAATLQVKPDNAATSVGDIKIQNATVITQPKPEAKGPAAVSATLFNEGAKDQTLDSVTLDGSGTQAELKPAKGSGKITVPAGGSVVIGGKGNASAVLASGREAVKDGDAQPVTFTFSRTGKVKLRAFVVPANSYFKEYGPSEVPQPGQSGAATPSGTGSPSESASGKPSESGKPSDAASSSEAAHAGH
ncbi:copper chaperone PCu(A)C [Streptomyces sp. NPDC053560]|uniref:copper chaperone PCu(A)C n=1 Tax=Streptomyces sp. NPDC053560 TaxID=3365711 RepID=UPI0037D89F38